MSIPYWLTNVILFIKANVNRELVLTLQILTRYTLKDSYLLPRIENLADSTLNINDTIFLIHFLDIIRSSWMKKTKRRHSSWLTLPYIVTRLCHLVWRTQGQHIKDSSTRPLLIWLGKVLWPMLMIWLSRVNRWTNKFFILMRYLVPFKSIRWN